LQKEENRRTQRKTLEVGIESTTNLTHHIKLCKQNKKTKYFLEYATITNLHIPWVFAALVLVRPYMALD
jgi:hypothetical protein